MNRAHFQDLSKSRLREAKVLLKAKEYSAVFYLSGYVIECALKATCLSAINE